MLASTRTPPQESDGRDTRGLPAARATLARAMRTFSLAAQPDYRERLRAWRTPLLWVTGDADAKFGAVAESLAHEGVPARFARCPGAGHRVPWDNPGAFAAIVGSWLAELRPSIDGRTNRDTNT